ncbi:MAG TPA: alpha/beta hydrolase [Urbifossiella sp.]|jgi:pimeloyl-ACP methyl ester carboxylesterase
MFTEHSIPAAGVRLNVAHGPKHGSPVWFFHGLCRRWQDFAPVYGSLAPLYTIRAADHRGHGKSSHAPGCYSIGEYIADATAIIRESTEPVAIIGHSLGAITALGVAATVPDAVRGIVMLDPPGPEFLANIDATFYSPMWDAMRRLAGNNRTIAEIARELAEIRIANPKGKGSRLGDLRDGAAIRLMARGLQDLDPDTLTLPLEKRWLGGFDLFAAARQTRCPVLLAVSDPALGGMLPPPESAALAAAIPDCHRVDLPGISHLIHWQDSHKTLLLLHAFLGSL